MKLRRRRLLSFVDSCFVTSGVQVLHKHTKGGGVETANNAIRQNANSRNLNFNQIENYYYGIPPFQQKY